MTARLRAYRPALLAVLAGVAHALSFAPGPVPGLLLPVLQLLAFAGFAVLVWRATSVRRAALVGGLFGMGNFLAGISWLYISLHDFGMMAAPLAAGGVFLLSVYLSLYPALAAALARWLSGASDTARPLLAALALGLAWAAGEWLRATVFTGFPWLNIAYAHVDGPLHGWAPVAGAYGVAFAAAWAGALLGAAWVWRASVLKAGLTLLAVLALGWGLSLPAWVTPIGEPLPVRLVQGNAPLSEKFDPSKTWDLMDRHLGLTLSPPADKVPAPALVVLPETTISVFQNQLSVAAWREWTDAAAVAKATLALGVAIHDPGGPGQRDRYYNSVVGVRPDTPPETLMSGRPAQRYDKRHLVPFGEFIPFGFRWFVDAMVMPLGDFDRGGIRQAPFAVRDQHVAMNICYEDVFGEELLPALHPGADGSPGATMFANVSNLAWFGDSFALAQHLQMSRMRVRETGRPMLRSTNTGMTAAIGHDGQVIDALKPFTIGRLDILVQGTTGLTPYARTGNLPILLLIFAGLAGLATLRLRARRADHTRHAAGG
ncbi:apolipoprotein N-acyltransferase [Pigmentiphaga aceris]|uniref:Apolipoprotein N-acyltransferase n=1 Tax=Pigmentiphaga aceris TaxID=1940612 RepID=A0A5C0B0H9_9BURK|nr:apolipoprotein N-acyltransferase [Pigmentiphaga aceris]QEI08118.1 apolipoprotein N-acyltransferase [Pigmentiphaga aceris]